MLVHMSYAAVLNIKVHQQHRKGKLRQVDAHHPEPHTEQCHIVHGPIKAVQRELFVFQELQTSCTCMTITAKMRLDVLKT